MYEYNFVIGISDYLFRGYLNILRNLILIYEITFDKIYFP